jgi:osmotically-inducible protein OsmY
MNANIIKGLVPVFLLAFLLGACAGSQTRQSTGEHLDDATITARVKAEFVADETVDALDIQVETFKGVVQLSGFADSQRQIDRAGQIARNTPGVQSVRNDVRLKSRT